MITGMHLTLYGSEDTVDELRAFMHDVLKLPSFDAGGGWLIFHMPGEIGCHPDDDRPSRRSVRHELAFVCDDLDKSVAEFKKRGVEFTTDIEDAGWGRLAYFKMPGGIKAVLYKPNYRKPRAR